MWIYLSQQTDARKHFILLHLKSRKFQILFYIFYW